MPPIAAEAGNTAAHKPPFSCKKRLPRVRRLGQSENPAKDMQVPQPKVADEDTPYWRGADPVMPLTPQSLIKKHDVVIVGAGCAELSPALAWGRAGRSVAASDATNPGDGASYQPQGGVPKVRVSSTMMGRLR